MSQACVIPLGDVMRLVAEDELIAMQPTSIAPAVVVVTPGSVPVVAAGP